MTKARKFIGTACLAILTCLCAIGLTTFRSFSASADAATSVKLYTDVSLGGQTMTWTNGSTVIKNDSGDNFNTIAGISLRNGTDIQTRSGYKEFLYCGPMEVNTRAFELSFDGIDITSMPIFEMKVGITLDDDTHLPMLKSHYGQTVSSKVYFYGTDALGAELRSDAYSVSYIVGAWTPVFIDLSESGIKTVTNIVVNPQFGEIKALFGDPDFRNIFTAFSDFGFTSVYKSDAPITLTANDSDYYVWNGNALTGLLDKSDDYKLVTATRSNGAAFDVGHGVAKEEYKYGTGRVAYNSYMIVNLNHPVIAEEGAHLNIQLYPHGQIPEDNWKLEDSDEFYFKVLPYNATENDIASATRYTLPKKNWGNIKIALTDLANVGDYVERFIIFYEGTEKTAERGEDAGNYSMNIILHNITIDWGNYFGRPTAMNVTLSGEIIASFKTEIPAEVLTDSTAYLSITVGEEETQIPVSEAEEVEGQYVFKKTIAPAQMTETITLKFVKGAEEGKAYTCSVREYAEKILNEEPGNSKKAELVKAMLNYGAWAQQVFDVNTDNLANEGYEIDFSETEPEGTFDISTAEATGVALTEFELFLKHVNSVRLYFTSVPPISNISVRVSYIDDESNQRIYTLNIYEDEQTGGCYVEIPAIVASKVNRDYTVTFKNTSDNSTTVVTLSLAGVARRVAELETVGSNKQILAKALYLYGVTAKDYAN